jgi:hypothetical protein
MISVLISCCCLFHELVASPLRTGAKYTSKWLFNWSVWKIYLTCFLHTSVIKECEEKKTRVNNTATASYEQQGKLRKTCMFFDWLLCCVPVFVWQFLQLTLKTTGSKLLWCWLRFSRGYFSDLTRSSRSQHAMGSKPFWICILILLPLLILASQKFALPSFAWHGSTRTFLLFTFLPWYSSS